MSDANAGFGEFVEARPGEMLEFRNKMVEQASGLGPCDMCIVYKRYKSAVLPQFLQKHPDAAYSHWTLGVDNSSPASLSAYFQAVIADQVKASWYAGGSYTIVGGVYCSFDAFTGLDLRVEMHIGQNPGIKHFGIDTQGRTYPTTERMWRGAFVTSGLRLITMPAAYLTCMNARKVHVTSLETKFLQHTSEFILNESRIQRGVPWELETADTRDVDVLQRIIHKYFMQHGRIEDTIKFFTPLLASRPVAAIPLASAYAARTGAFADAITVLLRALKRDPLCVTLLIAQAQTLLEAKKPHLALPLARTAVEQQSDCAEAWLVLARCYLALDCYEQVLIALNGLPDRPARMPENALEDLTSLPKEVPAKAETEPTARKEYVADHEWQFYDLEMEEQELMTDMHDPNEDPTLPSLKATTLDDISKASYSILVDLEHRVGWPALVRMAHSVFFMSGEDALSGSIPSQYESEIEQQRQVELELEQKEYQEWLSKMHANAEAGKLNFADNDAVDIIAPLPRFGAWVDGSMPYGQTEVASLSNIGNMYAALDPAALPENPSLQMASGQYPSSSNASGAAVSSATAPPLRQSVEPAHQPVSAVFPQAAASGNGAAAVTWAATVAPPATIGPLPLARSASELKSAYDAPNSYSSAAYAATSPHLGAIPPPISTPVHRSASDHSGMMLASLDSQHLLLASSPGSDPKDAAAAVNSDPVPRKAKGEVPEPVDPSRVNTTLSKRLCAERLHVVLECMYEDMVLLFTWHTETDRIDRRKAEEAAKRQAKLERRRSRKSSVQGSAPGIGAGGATSGSNGGSVRGRAAVGIVVVGDEKEHSITEHSITTGGEDDADETGGTLPRKGGRSGEAVDDDDTAVDPNTGETSIGGVSTSSTRRRKKKEYGEGEKSMAAWLSYAQTAERLKRPADAEIAYRKCLKMGFSRKAWQGLLELYLDHRSIRPALVASSELVRADESSQKHRYEGPKCVMRALLRLIGEFGYNKVQSEWKALGGSSKDGCRNFIARVLKNALLWRVKGYDR